MYACMYVCMYVMYVCMLCMYVCMYVHMYIRTYVHMYICTYVRRYVCICNIIICTYLAGDNCCSSFGAGAFKLNIEKLLPGIYVKSLKFGNNLQEVYILKF